MIRGHQFGHPTEYVYSDTKEPVDGANPRPCKKCGLFPDDSGEDPCWGHLPGVMSACCGHGVQIPFIVLKSGEAISGQEALDYVKEHSEEGCVRR